MKPNRVEHAVVYAIIIVLFCLNGCTSSREKIKTKALNAGFDNQLIESGAFNLFASIKINNSNHKTIVFYIEGDGQAWKHKHRLSDDPTPINPVSLNLAVVDPNPNIVYLARPCQYLKKKEIKRCSSIYWSSHRYGEEVVDAISEAITKIKSQSNATRIDLIGYSGGGVIAMLVAARRDDVRKIITIAANIDHESWSDWHQVSKLSGSLSPLDYFDKTKNIPQQHFWGGKDNIVPHGSQASFIKLNDGNAQFKYKIIPEFTHHCCWSDYWRKKMNP